MDDSARGGQGQGQGQGKALGTQAKILVCDPCHHLAPATSLRFTGLIINSRGCALCIWKYTPRYLTEEGKS